MEISDERMILVLFENASQRILRGVLCRGNELRRPVKVERVVFNAFHLGASTQRGGYKRCAHRIRGLLSPRRCAAVLLGGNSVRAPRHSPSLKLRRAEQRGSYNDHF